MLPCSADDFVRSPIGKYVVGESWFYFAEEALAGCVAWGRSGPRDAEVLMQLAATWIRPGAEPRASFFDMRGVDSAQAAEVFPIVRAYIADHREALAKVVTRFAIVHPDGFIGVLASGFLSIVQPPYPLRLFTSVDEALRWVEHPAPAAFAQELSEIQARVLSEAPPVRRLQRVLEERVRDITIAEAARSLGLSTRTLQRHLRDAQTTFERELSRTRVEAAQRLMVGTTANLTNIAFDVGCASPAHLSVLFRKITGESPSQWRARRTK